jgi:hypothetical protein
MATIRESKEVPRGCGYRQPKGLYVVGGALGKACGKLPHKLDRCPTCDHGIKPSRGWTWVNPANIFKPGVCKLAVNEVVGSVEEGRPAAASELFCSGCVLVDPPEKAGLLWIGEKFYPTPSDWLDEARRMGASRRIQSVPKDFVMGETIILVAHRKGVVIDCPDCESEQDLPAGIEPCETCEGGIKTIYAGAIFSAFTPTAVEYIVKGDETEEELERLEKRGLSLVKVIPIKEGEEDDDQEELDLDPSFNPAEVNI